MWTIPGISLTRRGPARGHIAYCTYPLKYKTDRRDSRRITPLLFNERSRLKRHITKTTDIVYIE